MDDVFRNPHRRKILELLSKNKIMTPKEMAEDLKIGVPTVYYHLELMSGYVAKTSRGEFSATERGLTFFKDSIKEEMSSSTSIPLSKTYAFFSMIVSNSLKFLPLSFLIGSIELALCFFMHFQPYLLSYSRSIVTESLPLNYVVNLIAIFVLLEGFSYAVTRRKGGELALFNGIMLSRIPLLFLMFDSILQITSVPFSIIILSVGQLISIYTLSTSLSFSKGIKQEISLIICLVILYLNLTIYSLI